MPRPSRSPSALALSLVLSLAVALALALTLPLAPALAADPSPAGSIKNVSGSARLIRAEGEPMPLNPGDRVYEKDVLVTGADGALGLVLRDDTVLSLGPGARLVIEKFLFEPAQGRLAQTLRLTRGSMAAVSGAIVKLNPAAAKVETPLYTIGIRGTHILVNMEPGHETPEEAAQ